jgi:hypothetical protein
MMFPTFAPLAFQKGRSPSEIDMGCKLGQEFDRLLLQEELPQFFAVVRLCIVQMDHNASKRFPPTLLTDAFHQVRNDRFDKEGCILFHAFRNIQHNFHPCATLNNRNEALFGLTFASKFWARHLDLRPSTNDGNIQKEPVFVPC